MDIPGIFGGREADAHNAPSPVIYDGSSAPAADNGEQNPQETQPDPPTKFVRNETIIAADKSAIGDQVKIPALKIPKTYDDDEPEPEPELEPEEEPKEPAPQPEPPVIPPLPTIDPEKETFIKAYTEEFDATVYRATEVAHKILAAIDVAINARASDIDIAPEADEFLDEAPEDHKVQRFEDARAIVSAIMDKANAAKERSAKEAAEAARIYDEVQKFKHDTEDHIKTLTSDYDAAAIAKFRADDDALDEDDIANTEHVFDDETAKDDAAPEEKIANAPANIPAKDDDDDDDDDGLGALSQAADSLSAEAAKISHSFGAQAESAPTQNLAAEKPDAPDDAA